PSARTHDSLLSFSHFIVLIRPRPRSPLFPYTTLFRSHPLPAPHAQAAPQGADRGGLRVHQERREDEAHPPRVRGLRPGRPCGRRDRKSTRLNSSHVSISYAVFCLKKKKHNAATSRSHH